MNSILQLKGRFEQRSNRSRPGSPKLPKGKSVSASHLRELEKQLERILVYWTENKDIRGALVSVHYKHIVAKSNRHHRLDKCPYNAKIRSGEFIAEIIF